MEAHYTETHGAGGDRLTRRTTTTTTAATTAAATTKTTTRSYLPVQIHNIVIDGDWQRVFARIYDFWELFGDASILVLAKDTPLHLRECVSHMRTTTTSGGPSFVSRVMRNVKRT